jgi:hypothetical protein
MPSLTKFGSYGYLSLLLARQIGLIAKEKSGRKK